MDETPTTDATPEPPGSAAASAPPDGDRAPTGADAHDGTAARRGQPRGRRASDRYDVRQALTYAVGIGGGLLLADGAVAATGRLRPLLMIVLLSLFLSFAMEPAVQWLHRRGVRRGFGTGMVFAAMIGLGTAFVLAMSGLVADQVRNLVDAGPRLLDQLASRATELPPALAEPIGAFLEQEAAALPDRLAGSAGVLSSTALGLSTTLIGLVFSTFAVVLLTFYLVADGPRLRWQLSRRLEPARQRELLRVWELAIAKTGGYVYSRVLLAVVSAAVHTVAFTIADVRYAAALGVWMGLVSSVIPVVGLYIAGALPVIVSLASPDASTLTVLLVIVVYQQVENYLVQPRITEHTLALHPAVSFVSVIAGAALLGPLGALLALPTAAIVAALVTTYSEEHEVLAHGLTTTPDSVVRVAP